LSRIFAEGRWDTLAGWSPLQRCVCPGAAVWWSGGRDSGGVGDCWRRDGTPAAGTSRLDLLALRHYGTFGQTMAQVFINISHILFVFVSISDRCFVST
jgi:hypothetical protein